MVASLGFTDSNLVAVALTATNTVSSVIGPNLTADPTGFDDPNFSVNTLAQSLAAGANINNLGLNSGSTNFHGERIGHRLFRTGSGSPTSQSVVGNFASTIDPTLGLTTNALNRGLLSFGGLGANNSTFGLANALRNSNRIGFNGGLGLNNGLGFNTTPTSPTFGNPLSNRLGFDVLGLDRGRRSTFGLDILGQDPTTGFPTDNPGNDGVDDGTDTDPVPDPGDNDTPGTARATMTPPARGRARAPAAPAARRHRHPLIPTGTTGMETRTGMRDR